MKLLTKYNRANILTAVVILLASSVSYYFIIRHILLQQLDKDLKVEQQEIYEFVKENNALPNASAYKGQEIRFEVADAADIPSEIRTATISNVNEHEDEPVRVLSFPVTVRGVLHKAVVIKSQVEAEELLQLIVVVTGAIIFLLLLIVSLINRFMLGKLWQPFYQTLEQLRAFDVKSAKVLELPKTGLAEFDELNSSVSVMAKRITNEFETLKSFTENASHEMQTPVAIINSKLDILLQLSDEKQAEQLQSIYNATSRLSRLNQTLLLLTKINNEQFKEVQQVNLQKLFEQKLYQFDELIKSRDLRISVKNEPVQVTINEELADILMNNLLSNAIKHNFDNGFIDCRLTDKMMMISNGGPALSFNKEEVFQRFKKGSHSTGTGLGLAVVQQICDSSGFAVTYTNTRGEHTFTIIFN